MTKWTIAYDGAQIGKDNVFFDNLDVSWLPSDILAVQSDDGVTCEIERGDRTALEITQANEEDVATSGLSWWSNVSTSWQAGYDAYHGADLSALAVSSGALSPSFAADNSFYTVDVANSVTSVTVTPTAAYTDATITVAGTAVTSDSASGSQSLDVGSNIVDVVVSRSGSDDRTYTILFERAEA